MKKLLMIGTLCFTLVVFAGSAFADVAFSGTCFVNYIAISSSDNSDVPTCASKLDLFITVGDETFQVTAEAFGTLINVGLLKAWNESIPISCKGGLVLGEGPSKQGFRVIITKIDFTF